MNLQILLVKVSLVCKGEDIKFWKKRPNS